MFLVVHGIYEFWYELFYSSNPGFISSELCAENKMSRVEKL